MSILQMSIFASMLIIAIIIIRAATLNKLPKTMFLILWGVVLLRLLIPVSIPSQFSVYTFINGMFSQSKVDMAIPIIKTEFPIGIPATGAIVETDTAKSQENIMVMEPLLATREQAYSIAPTTIIWLTGMLAMFAFFTVVYFKNHRELQFALRINDNEFLGEWLTKNKLLRPITILQSDRLTTPVAVGLIRPRIILPKIMNMHDKQLLRHVLTHEYYHIRRLDTLWKMLLTAALCIHWFNPMVWVMLLLVNRDLELTCDEMVIHHFGAETKAAYAYSLIDMAEKHSKFTLLYNAFNKNSVETRIIAVMKYKQPSVIAIALAVFLVMGTTTAFAFSASSSIDPNAADINRSNFNAVPSLVHADINTTNYALMYKAYGMNGDCITLGRIDVIDDKGYEHQASIVICEGSDSFKKPFNDYLEKLSAAYTEDYGYIAGYLDLVNDNRTRTYSSIDIDFFAIEEVTLTDQNSYAHAFVIASDGSESFLKTEDELFSEFYQAYFSSLSF